MDENYRLFFKIELPDLEVVEEETNGNGRLVEEENEGGEYEDELGKEGEFEVKLLKEDKLGDEADEGLVGKEIPGAVQTYGLPFMVAFSSTKWLSPQLSTPKVTEVGPKPDTEQESELAVFLESLMPTEELKCWEEVEPGFQSEIESKVSTL